MDQNLYRTNGDVAIMNFSSFCWADSDLEKIQIEFDHAALTIWNNVLQKRLIVHCWGLAGITNLCIWDDTTIINSEIAPVTHQRDIFVQNLFAAYKANYNYGGRSLDTGLLALRIELSNHIQFIVYCQSIDVLNDV